MEQSKPYNQEGNGRATVEDINQLNLTALGEVAVVCQVCGSELQEGSPVVAYAFRPTGEPTFEIGHVRCADDRHVPTECFTLGVRGLVVEGRVGWCSDQATQSSWPVLLAPEVLVVSPASTTAVSPVPGVAWFRRPPEECEACRVVDSGVASSVELRPWQRPVVVERDESDSGVDETAAVCGLDEELIPDGGVSSWSADTGIGGDR